MIVKKTLVLAVLILTAIPAFAQKPKKKAPPKLRAKIVETAAPDNRVDTARLANLAPGLDARFIETYAQGSKIDTMMWGGEDGASIVRFDGKYLGYRGRYVIGLQGKLIDQVAFNMIPMSKEEALGAYDAADKALRQSLGTPVDTYANVVRMVTWQGQKQKLVIQTKDDAAFFSVILTYLPPPKSQKKTGPKNWWEK